MRAAALLLFVVSLTGCPSEDGPCKTVDDCKKGFGCCAGKCTDVQNDKSNCGECGLVCDFPNSMPACRVGRCQLSCTSGFGNCNGERDDGCETDLTTMVNNCGVCGRTCTSINAEPVCRAALCTAGTCSPNFANCDSDSTTGCEVDTRTDSAHCGGCDNACSLPHASSACQASACAVTACTTPWGDCDGTAANGCEIDTTSNALHCSRCNTACGPRQGCVNSECRANELILFGGALSFTTSATTAELHRFDLGTNTFSPINATAPNGTPPARGRHLAAWDAPRNRMIVWGGVDGAGTPVATDVWALEFATEPPRWTKLSVLGTPPSPRFAPVSALDARAGKLYVYGGTTELGGGLSDLHTFDLATNTWARIHDSGAMNAPRGRVNAMGAFDPVARVFLVFGGNDTVSRGDFSELWQFDVVAQGWRTPPYDAVAGGPPGRARGAFFDGHPVFLFSGINSLLMAPASMADDLRTVDVDAGTPWVLLPSQATSPAARFNAGFAVRDGQLYVYSGGATSSTGQQTFSDLWKFDPASGAWARLSDGTGAPMARLAPTMVAR